MLTPKVMISSNVHHVVRKVGTIGGRIYHDGRDLAMNARNEALLEEAKQQGYLVMRYGYNNTLKARYFQWCRSQKTPAIYVWFHGQVSSFESNTEPVLLGYYESETDGDLFDSPDFTPTPELEDRLSLKDGWKVSLRVARRRQ
jgi:hypothetical protein